MKRCLHGESKLCVTGIKHIMLTLWSKLLAVLYYIMYPLLPHAELKHSLNLPINAWGVSWASQVGRIRACPVVPQCVRKMLWYLSRRCFSRLASESKGMDHVDGSFSQVFVCLHDSFLKQRGNASWLKIHNSNKSWSRWSLDPNYLYCSLFRLYHNGIKLIFLLENKAKYSNSLVLNSNILSAM